MVISLLFIITNYEIQPSMDEQALIMLTFVF